MPDTDEAIVTLTEKAQQLVLDALSQSRRSEDDDLALWVEVLGMRAGEVYYDFHFDSAESARHGDAVYRGKEVTVVIPSHSIGRLHGSTLDVAEGDSPLGLVVINPYHEVPVPSTPPIETRSHVELSGTIEQRITKILEEQVNPSIAIHGGTAELVSVQDGRAYLRMGGSCVGCGLASATLNEGIANVIRQSLPEIESVIDVTDHASGTNPFFPSHK